MSSIASSLYKEDQRAKCYTCPQNSGGDIKVAGRQMRLECRKFTEYGNAFETMATVMMTSIFMMNLIHIMEIGVDTARLSFGKHFEFKTQSRGSGGLSKYDCGSDYQIPKLIKHEKFGHTERLYVHWTGCPNKFISTELQGMWFTNDEYADNKNMDNELSDALVMSARKSVSTDVEWTDIIGVFGGHNDKANAYDGILTQAYWAHELLAYFHSVEFTVDEALLQDGSFLHAKYGGTQCTIDIEYDSTQASDPASNRYATRQEVYQAVVDWLNNDVLTESGRKYVDATYNNNQIIATSKWTEREVELMMFIDMRSTVSSWIDCTLTGVSYEVLQGRMPVDERPHLVEWNRYTPDNILTLLPRDIYHAMRDMDKDLKPEGAEYALYLDPYIWEMYQYARQDATQDKSRASLEEKFSQIYEVPALGAHGGTGLWFVTIASTTEELRNVAHLVDTARTGTDIADIFVGPANTECDEMKIKYDTLHGVTVKDWRLFASNLLCSPFVDTFKDKEPWEKTLPYLPCWNKKVRDTFLEDNFEGECKIRAQFEIVDEYQNSALYAIPLAAGGYDIRVLEDGDVLPNGALPVYEIQVMDKTVGIPASKLSEVTYEYVVQTNDGTEVVYNTKNPIIQYVGTAAGTAFNISQTVEIPSLNCESNYDASLALGEDFPFRMAGACADLAISLEGRIDRTNDYTISGANWDETVNITVVGVGADTIDLSTNATNDAVGAAAIINAYLTTNSLGGIAVGDNDTDTLRVDSSVDVVFVDITDGITPVLFTREHRLTIVDSTQWDVADGIGEIDIFVYCQGDPPPVDPTFEALPELELIDSCVGNGWTIDVNLTSKLGCTFEGLTVNVAEIVDPAQDASFEITA